MNIVYCGRAYLTYISSLVEAHSTEFRIQVLNESEFGLQEYISSNSPQLVIMDSDGSLSWKTMLTYTRNVNLNVHFILLACTESENVAVQAFRSGVTDYIQIREIESLPRRIRNLNHPKRNGTITKIAESISDGLMVLDAQGVISYASPSVTNILGHAPQDIVNLPMIDFLHPDDITPVREKVAEVLNNPGVVIKGHTGRMAHKNGDWRWIEASAANMLHDPEINGIVDTFRDVTERVENSLRLRKSEELLTNTMDALTISIALIDNEGEIIGVNRAWKEFAMENGDPDLMSTCEGSNYINICKLAFSSGDQYAERAYHGLMNVLSGDALEFSMEYPCDSPDEKRWFIMQARKCKGDDSIVISHLDISDRRRAEQELKGSEIKFRALLEQNRDGIALLDHTFKPVYVSPATYQILGYSEDEVLNLDLSKIVHPEDAYILGEVMQQAMANPGIATPPKVTRMMTSNGDWKYIEGTLNNMLDDPNIRAIVDNFRDVTGEKVAYEKLLKSNRRNSILGKTNAIIAHSANESEMLENLSSALGELGQYCHIWFAKKKPNNKKFNLIAAHGFPQKWKLGLQEYDLIEQVLSHGQTEFFEHDDISRQDVSLNGLCLPIVTHSGTDLIFTLYSDRPGFFDTEEINLVREITDEISFALDIFKKDNERRQTERLLLIQNAKLRQVQAVTKLGTWEVDLETSTATWSDELLDIYGFPPEHKHVTYAEWKDRIHPDDKDIPELSREQARSARSNYSVAHRIIRTDGEVRHIVSQISFERNQSGKSNVLIGVAQDVTHLHDVTHALRLAEKAHMRSETRYRQIVELANEGICLLNQNQRIVFSNNRLSEILGYNSDELFNENLLDFLFVKDKRTIRHVSQLLSEGKSDVIELCLTANTGQPVWVRMALSAIADDFQEYKGSIILVSDITERTDAERKNKFKAHLLNNVAQAVAGTDKNGIITYWNQSAERFFGHLAGEVLGKKFKDIVHPSRKLIGKEMWRTVQAGQIWSDDIEIDNDFGANTILNISAQPIFDGDQKFDGMLSITTDVTEQRRLKTLLESSARLAKLGHFEIDLVSMKVTRSLLAKEILGVQSREEDNVLKSFEFYKPGTSRETVELAFKNAVEKGTSWDIQVELISTDEKPKWVRIIGDVKTLDDKAVHIFGSIQDISDQKAAERAALDAYRERNIILESVGDAFFAVDQNWVVKYWNNNAETVLSTPRDAIVGNVLWDVFPEYVGTPTYRHYFNAMELQTRVEFDEFYFSFQKWLQVSVYPSSLGLSIYFKDITGRKFEELRMVELNEELTTYTNDLVAINNELKQFSYIVSHNLRSPVTNIMGLAEELKDENYDADTRSIFIDSIKTSADRLNNVIIDLNDVLRLKAGGVKQKEIVDLKNSIDAVIEIIRPQINEANATIEIDFSAVRELTTIKSYLHSILHNLLLNAVKYRNPNHAPIISIRSVRNLDGVWITVSDNGLGIDLAKFQNDLFSMYKRFHFHVEGKGMGLFMVKTQIEILGGNIFVESSPGHGTTFTLCFPG